LAARRLLVPESTASSARVGPDDTSIRPIRFPFARDGGSTQHFTDSFRLRAKSPTVEQFRRVGCAAIAVVGSRRRRCSGPGPAWWRRQGLDPDNCDDHRLRDAPGHAARTADPRCAAAGGGNGVGSRSRSEATPSARMAAARHGNQESSRGCGDMVSR